MRPRVLRCPPNESIKPRVWVGHQVCLGRMEGIGVTLNRLVQFELCFVNLSKSDVGDGNEYQIYIRRFC